MAQVTPGVRITSLSGPVKGSFDYGLSAVIREDGSVDVSQQNRLAANARVEVVPNHFDISATGNISRQARSAFGQQSAEGFLTDVNQSEVRTFSVQPTLRGVLAGVVGVQASATGQQSSASNSDFGASSQSASLTLSSVSSGTVFGWSLNGTRQIADFEGGRETTTDRVTASVSIRPDVDWVFTLRGGQERTDVASLQQQSYDNWGAGVRWTPTPRTTISLDGDRRFFGDGYSLALNHRMRRTVFSYSASRSAADGIGTGVAAVRAYDLFFELFASQEPDPVLRDLLVRSFLITNGIPPDAIVGGIGFLTRATSLQTRHQFSMAVSFLRSTLTTTVYTSQSERIDTVSGAVDDLSGGPVRQQGLSVAYSHRLTPRDSLSASATASRTPATGLQGSSRLVSLSLAWSSRISQRANFSLLVRHSDAGGNNNDYTENAVTAAFNTSF